MREYIIFELRWLAQRKGSKAVKNDSGTRPCVNTSRPGKEGKTADNG
jgi:hypothetical protein